MLGNPERGLLTAILRRALYDYFGKHSINRLQAREWLFDECHSNEAFSFSWVCQHLGFQAEDFRKQMRLMIHHKDWTGKYSFSLLSRG